jgi:hypothetical protein
VASIVMHGSSRVTSSQAEDDHVRQCSARGEVTKISPRASRDMWLDQAAAASTRVGTVTPANSARRASTSRARISAAIAACSVKYAAALSRPWPMRSPLYE